MLILNSISGNVHHNDQIKEEIHQAEKQQKLERLFLSRTEMEKSRLRKHTSDGLEIGLSLDPGTIMRDGDVLSNNSKFIMMICELFKSSYMNHHTTENYVSN